MLSVTESTVIKVELLLWFISLLGALFIQAPDVHKYCMKEPLHVVRKVPS